MVELFRLEENPPFPNHPLPVLFYPEALINLIENSKDPGNETIAFFEEKGYTNGWVNGIHDFHHFHSNTHEVLACIKGSATVQIGGPQAEEHTFTTGDVVLIPAGVAHKRLTATDDFKVVGAYPNGKSPDMHRGDAPDYEDVQQRCYDVLVPDTDPVYKYDGPVQKHWSLSEDN
ncbi:MAG: cupin domain-containing protein [Alkalibacterium sp.]|nr:cupin domain-containing protein [Alkalibacterium sp.]